MNLICIPLILLNNDANKYTLNLISNYTFQITFMVVTLLIIYFHCFTVNECGTLML